MKRLLTALLLFVLTVSATVAYCQEPAAPAGTTAIEDPVQITSGPITGEVKDGVRCYKGVPYAAPPVGELRWKPPQLHKSWKEPRTCTEFGPSCPQHKDEVTRGLGKMDEDCLYLNVWTPAKTGQEALPVMVWIHGGGFVIGSGSLAPYHGENLAGRGVVVVTINYRLGVFGFFAHPGLSAESPDKVSGNYGLLDQIFALRWVKENIKKFGGDPGNVTIFGESAGAVSVCALIASPLARGLFHRGIVQSGSAPPDMPYLRKDAGRLMSWESKGVRFAKKMGVDKAEGVIAELRKKSWQEILDADTTRITLPGSTPMLCIDGHVLPDAPLNIIKSGKGAKVPLVIGTNKDEGTLFTIRVKVNTVRRLRAFWRMLFRDKTQEALKLYNVTDDASAAKAFSNWLGDAFVVAVRRTARAHAASGNKTYLYHFTREPRWAKLIGLGSFHGCEIQYVFGTQPRLGRFRKADREISGNMMGYWARFAKSGDPNGESCVKWPAYTAEKDEHLIIDTEIKAGKDLRKKYCDFLDSVRKP